MTILTAGIRGLLGKSANVDRPSMTPFTSVVGAVSGSVNKQEQLQAISLSSWVFAAVDKIATGTAAPQWQLYKGDKEIESHPFLDFWERPNPFMTGAMFREIGAQHYELTGETWWSKVYNRGVVTELWPLRPDRIRPIPHAEKFLAGYIYQIGAQRIPFEPDDVVSIRRPHPYDPYRGIGPIENLMMDLQSERQASVWTRNFYVNNASPGGVVQIEENMTDAEFEKFRSRWEIMHKGVNNAHRVAFLEGGMEWKDARLSQRDMQFVDWRKLNRDVIIGAWGLPGAVLGISETVDRAASESAEAMFARWVIVPRLNRIRDAVNVHLLPAWGEGLRLDYVNPVPDDRALDLAEATQGYSAGFVTLDEARIKLDLPPIGGDEGGKRREPVAVNPYALKARTKVGYDEQEHPRDESGHWSDKPGTDDATSDATPVEEPTAADLQQERDEYNERSRRSRASYKQADAGKQRHAETRQAEVGQRMDMAVTPNNHTLDLVLEKQGVEVKVFVDNKNDKATMHPPSRLRKETYARKNKLTLHTVILDDRDIYDGGMNAAQYSGHKIYYRRGVGAFRLGSMYKVKDWDELKVLINSPKSKLPSEAFYKLVFA